MCPGSDGAGSDGRVGSAWGQAGAQADGGGAAAVPRAARAERGGEAAAADGAAEGGEQAGQGRGPAVRNHTNRCRAARLGGTVCCSRLLRWLLVRREKPAIPKSSKKILAESQRATSQSRNPSFLKRSEQLLEEKRAREAAAAQRELQESQRVSAKKSVDRCAHSLVPGSAHCLGLRRLICVCPAGRRTLSLRGPMPGSGRSGARKASSVLSYSRA